MRRMGWSWPAYCALPHAYLPVLVRMIHEEDAESKRRAAASRRKR